MEKTGGEQGKKAVSGLKQTLMKAGLGRQVIID